MSRWGIAVLASIILHAGILVGVPFLVPTSPHADITSSKTKISVLFQKEVIEKTQAEIEKAVLHQKSEAPSLPVSKPLEQAGVEWREPKYKMNPAPPYPRPALMRNVQGTVVLVVVVDPFGLPESVEIEKSSGSRLLDQAAVEAIKKWEFVPAMRAGISIKSKSRIPITFYIEEEK